MCMLPTGSWAKNQHCSLMGFHPSIILSLDDVPCSKLCRYFPKRFTLVNMLVLPLLLEGAQKFKRYQLQPANGEIRCLASFLDEIKGATSCGDDVFSHIYNNANKLTDFAKGWV